MANLPQATAGLTRERAREILSRWRALGPQAFAWDVFGLQFWSEQADWVLDAWCYDQVSVKSGHKTGKSLGVAAIALAWVSCTPGARVIITAPTYRQIRTVTWVEFFKLNRIANDRGLGLGGKLAETPNGGWRWPDGREIIGFSTNDPNRFNGLSGANNYFVVDEASGVDRAIFEAIEGARTGGGRLLKVGNPTSLDGVFFDDFNDPQARKLFEPPFGALHTISSENSPNVRYGRDLVPGLATLRAIERDRIAWGPDYLRDPRYQARILGQFPDAAADRVIPLWLVERAKERFLDALYDGGDKRGDPKHSEEWLERNAEGRMVVGVDVARYGDDRSCIRMRRGKVGFRPVFFQKQDGPGLAQHVLDYALARRRNPQEKPLINVDVIGWGASCYDALRHHKLRKEFEVSAVNVGEAANDSERYANLRSEAYFGLREWMRDGGALWLDHQSEAELLAQTYKVDERGRIRLEAKDEIKARLDRSPDDADAMMLMAHAGGARQHGGAVGTGVAHEDMGIGI